MIFQVNGFLSFYSNMSKRPRLPLSYTLYASISEGCGFSTFQFAAARACLELKGFCPYPTDGLPAPHSTGDLPALGPCVQSPVELPACAQSSVEFLPTG